MYDYEEPYYEDYYDDPYYDYDDEVGEDDSNSAGINVSEDDSMANAQVGQRFSTGNATVRNLKVGTVIEVVGQGQLEIVEVPEVVFNEGDRVYTKHGAASIVRLSSRFAELIPFDADTQVLYVADKDDVVRKANKGDVSHL